MKNGNENNGKKATTNLIKTVSCYFYLLKTILGKASKVLISVNSCRLALFIL